MFVLTVAAASGCKYPAFIQKQTDNLINFH
jgi:hypothetical protein